MGKTDTTGRYLRAERRISTCREEMELDRGDRDREPVEAWAAAVKEGVAAAREAVLPRVRGAIASVPIAGKRRPIRGGPPAMIRPAPSVALP